MKRYYVALNGRKNHWMQLDTKTRRGRTAPTEGEKGLRSYLFDERTLKTHWHPMRKADVPKEWLDRFEGVKQYW